MDWLGKTSSADGKPRTHKRAFLWPNGVYFLPHLATSAIMTGAVIPTPSVIDTVNKTVKICGKYKIVHNKHC